jgi:hypothetical protein
MFKVPIVLVLIVLIGLYWGRERGRRVRKGKDAKGTEWYKEYKEDGQGKDADRRDTTEDKWAKWNVTASANQCALSALWRCFMFCVLVKHHSITVQITSLILRFSPDSEEEMLGTPSDKSGRPT